MKDCDINIDRAQDFREKFKSEKYKVLSNDISGKLISEAIEFSSPYLDRTVEFQDLKNHLVLFYEEQRKYTLDRSYVIPNYSVLNTILLSLRQLIIEMLKQPSLGEQLHYLERICTWFYSK